MSKLTKAGQLAPGLCVGTFTNEKACILVWKDRCFFTKEWI